MHGSAHLSKHVALVASICILCSCDLFEPETRKECWSPDCSPRDGGTAGSAATDGGAGSGGASGSAGAGADDAGPDSGIAGDGSLGACPGSSCTVGSVCDESTGTCVQCLGDMDCSGSRPACDTTSHTCVGCTQSALHCSGVTSLCDTKMHACVECVSDSNCTDPSASHCEAGACEACTKNAQCSHLVSLGVCDTSSGSGECVQCTGTDDSMCAASGKHYVCNSLMKTCTTKEAGSAPPCGACVADAQCAVGTACMHTRFGLTDIGYFCLWKQDATGAGAPNGSCGNVRPYTVAESSWTSADNKTPTVCKSRTATCAAQNDFSSKSCSGVGTAGDAECGVSAVEDGYCAPFSGGGFRCTVPCVAYDDCKVTQGGADMECQSQNLGGQLVDVCQFQ